MRLKKVNPLSVILFIAIVGKVNGNIREKYCIPKGIPSNGQTTPKIKNFKREF